MFLFIGVIVAGIASYFWYRSACKRDNDRYGPGTEVMVSGGFAIGTAVILCLMALIWLASYPASVGHNAELKVFYTTTITNYKYEVDATSKIVIDSKNLQYSPEQKNIAIDLSKLTHEGAAGMVSDKISQLVNAVTSYNENLAIARRYNSFWLTDPFFEDPDPNLQFITLQMPKN